MAHVLLPMASYHAANQRGPILAPSKTCSSDNGVTPLADQSRIHRAEPFDNWDEGATRHSLITITAGTTVWVADSNAHY